MIVTKHINRKEINIRWGEINECSDHVPIYVTYNSEDMEKVIDSTRIMVRCRKKMEWKSRELLYNLFQADSEQEINTAFESCYGTKIKENKIKPFDVEKVYEKVNSEVNGK